MSRSDNRLLDQTVPALSSAPPASVATLDGTTSPTEGDRLPGHGQAPAPAALEQPASSDLTLDAPALASAPPAAGQETGDFGEVLEAHKAATWQQDQPVPVVQAQDPSFPLIPGYEILGVLGQGGMGVVYRARQVGLNRLVAIKMLLAGNLGSPVQQQRFLKEAEAIARLRHPNIVQVYEIGEVNGNPFFAMEFVEGGSLDRYVNDRPQPAEPTARLMQTVALAVHAAHQQGIIHRDLKPANILLQLPQVSARALLSEAPRFAQGLPKISDFGLAKDLKQADGPTQTGDAMGTPTYMPPEQVQGLRQRIGPATDVYALGVILYELLTGRPPFNGTTIMDTLLQVLREEPVPPTRLVCSVPRDLEVICLKCLQKDPRQRYATAADLAEDLRRFLAHEPIIARPATLWERGRKWVRRRPAVAALSGALLLLAVCSFVLVTWQWRKAVALAAAEKTQRRRAQVNFQHAREAVDQMLTRVAEERLSHEPRLEQVRRDLLELAQRFQQRFLDADSTDPDVRWEAGRSWQRLGEIRHRLGDHQGAAQAYAKGRELLGGLVQQAPRDIRYQHDLAVCLDNQGNLEQDTGQLAEAVASYQQALAIWQEMLPSLSKLSSAHLEHPRCRRNLGLVLERLDRWTEAEAELNAVQTELEVLVSAPSTPAVFKQELARVRRDLGQLMASRGRQQEAEQMLLRARDGIDQLSQRSAHPAHRQDRAGCCYQLGSLFRDRDPGRSARYHEQALSARQQLVGDFPTVPVYRQELAASYQALAQLAQAGGKVQLADRYHASALEQKDKLVKDYPAVPDFRLDLARNLANRAIGLQTQQRLTEAEPLCWQAVDLLEKLVRAYPEAAEYARELATQELNLGTLLQGMRRPEDADRFYGRALGHWQKLASRPNALPDDHNKLAGAHRNRGALHQLNGRLPQAEQSYRQALAELASLVKQVPGEPDYRFQQATTASDLATLLRDQAGTSTEKQDADLRRLAEAEQLYQQGLNLLDGLRREVPGVPLYREQQMHLRNELGLLLSAAGRQGEAREALQAAVEQGEQLVRDHSGTAAYQQGLAFSLGTLARVLTSVQPKEAEESFRRAVALLETLHRQQADEPSYWEGLIQAHLNLARFLRARDGSSADALASSKRALELRRRQVAVFPNESRYRSELAREVAELARQLEKTDPEEAQRLRREAGQPDTRKRVERSSSPR